jgi:hypothetical protein
MLTLFSCPKPFKGRMAIIQRNAIQSWERLDPKIEIILMGDEEGVAETAAHFCARHIPEVRRNEYGTPLLDDLFLKAQKTAAHEIMCYINADIILMCDFIQAVEIVRKSNNAFLMVGKRWDISVECPLDFSLPAWENKLRGSVYQSDQSMPPNWIDYFVFRRGFYTDLLPFAIGRAAFDNWLLWKACFLGASIIDASQMVMAVHQGHDYSHHPQGKNGVWYGAEAQRNRELMGGGHHFFTLDDASHRLTSAGLKLNLSRKRLVRKTIRLLHWLLIRMLLVRNRLGLCKSNVHNLW